MRMILMAAPILSGALLGSCGPREPLVGEPLPLGDVDISFYRDDVGLREPGAQPVVHASHIDFSVERHTVVLVDDVLFTGRTVRAAIDALFDYGRPASVRLAVLVDRGGRELPVQADFAAARVALPASQSLALARDDGGTFQFQVKEA